VSAKSRGAQRREVGKQKDESGTENQGNRCSSNSKEPTEPVELRSELRYNQILEFARGSSGGVPAKIQDECKNTNLKSYRQNQLWRGVGICKGNEIAKNYNGNRVAESGDQPLRNRIESSQARQGFFLR
jgi:hypothetical protein